MKVQRRKRERSAGAEYADIVRVLTTYLMQAFPFIGRITEHDSVRERIGLSDWMGVAYDLNRLPEIILAGLFISYRNMAKAQNVSQIVRAAFDATRGQFKQTPASPFLHAFEQLNKGAKQKDRVHLPFVAPITFEAPAEWKKFLRDRLPPSLRGSPEGLTYTVWYGTNRQPVDPGDSSKGYSSERGTKIHLGACQVFIPHHHRIGSTGSSWWRRLITGVDDRLRITGLGELSPAMYWSRISTQLASLKPTEREALVFVHGYNVSFRDAALRAAQLGTDLAVRGAMAFFSWPSRGTVRSYTADEASIEASERAVTEFITMFAKRSGASKVHIIAHSMGNRGVLRAVNRIAASAQRETGISFDQIILAAADVDADTFRDLSSAYARVSRRTTLYVSAQDRAVEASRWLHNFPRAGLTPPIMIVPRIDTISVTGVDLTLLGHGYVAEAREVLTDMYYILRHGSAPQNRFGLRPAQSPEGRRYWQIGK